MTSELFSASSTSDYGFTALPADQSKTPPSTSRNPRPAPLSTLNVPRTPLATRVATYAKSKLPWETYNHSLRVYSFGLAIARDLYPDWNLVEGSTLEETWFLTAMLHDIGTSDEFISSTRLSFEFWGGFHALQFLQGHTDTDNSDGTNIPSQTERAPRQQAESVAEAIIRHQDVQDKGNVTLITRLIHLGTLLDNIGAGAEMVDQKTVEEVCKAYPRGKWSGCFKKTVELEKKLKPYAMVSRIEGFEEAIMKNTEQGEVMAAYEG